MAQPMLILTNPENEQRYRFSLDTAAYQGRSRTTTYRWAKQERLTREPALQFVGPGDDTLKLSGVIYPHYKGGLGQVDSMRQEAGKGKPFILIEGTGTVFGKFVIESISEDQEHFMANGTPKKISFTLDLRKFGGE